MSRSTRSSAADLVGVDFARVRVAARRRRRAWLPAALLGALLAALGLAQLRLQILRMRYALGEATVQVEALREERSRWTAKLESLRGPERLTKLARERGLAPAERVIELPATQTAAGLRP
jgi:hypothetical protein